MKDEFSARYVRAAKVYGDSPSEDRIANEYASYLSGEYAVCLRFLSPGDHLSKGICDGENPGASGNARSKRR